MKQRTNRQHFISQFYLRNFADPTFSKNLHVYDLEKKRWESRTPRGVGWSPHLSSMFDANGQRTDEFDQYLKRAVEDPAAPVLKKIAERHKIEDDDREVLASFIGLISARSPDFNQTVLEQYTNTLAPTERLELTEMVRHWCLQISRPFDSFAIREFLKPSSLGGILYWSKKIQYELLCWKWHLVKTTFELPFVTSDRPVFGQREKGASLVSFPISSETALIVIDGGELDLGRDRAHEVEALNSQTIQQAQHFVVSCQESFPGDQLLATRNDDA